MRSFKNAPLFVSYNRWIFHTRPPCCLHFSASKVAKTTTNMNRIAIVIPKKIAVLLVHLGRSKKIILIDRFAVFTAGINMRCRASDI